MAASILRAETFGIPIPDWVKNPKNLAEAVDKVIVPEFQPKKDATIVTDETATSLSTSSVDDAAVIDDLIVKLDRCRMNLRPGFRMTPIQFEKVSFYILLQLVNYYTPFPSNPTNHCLRNNSFTMLLLSLILKIEHDLQFWYSSFVVMILWNSSMLCET